MQRASFLVAAVLGATALTVGACGGDEGAEKTTQQQSGGSSGGGQTLKLSADPGGELKFDKTELTAKAGKVTIDFDNPADVPHAVEVEGSGVEEKTETVTKAKSRLSADLKAGEYEFYCPVGNHKQQGMEGTLKVE